MTKNDLLTLFTSCPPDSPLFNVAHEAVKHLQTSTGPRIVLGDPQPCAVLLRIYRHRLNQATDRHEQIPGLEETAKSFTSCNGQLRGGYAEFSNHLIYFWADGSGNLAGCVL